MTETWREIYDTHHCPRDDGGRLQDKGLVVDYPGDSPKRFFACSTCGKWWTVCELRRVAPGPAVKL